MSPTVRYYDSHATHFVEGTLHVDMSSLRGRFLAHVPAGGLILDAGCGSGRDSKAFLDAGFRVRAFDASSELARRTPPDNLHTLKRMKPLRGRRHIVRSGMIRG